MLTHLSYSSVNKYRSCPKSWKFHYLDGVRGDKSEALEVGSFAHEVIEEYLANSNELSLEECYHKKAEDEAEGEEYPSINHKRVDGMKSFSIDSRHFFDGIFLHSALEDVLNGYCPKAGESIAVESNINFNVPGVEIPVTGYIDLLTVDKTIVDFKTSKVSWNQAKADKELQASFYATALYLNGVVPYSEPVNIDYVVMVKTKTPKVQVISTQRTANDISLVFNTVSEIWKAIKKEAFPPNASSWLCSSKYCAAWDLCEGGKIL